MDPPGFLYRSLPHRQRYAVFYRQLPEIGHQGLPAVDPAVGLLHAVGALVVGKALLPQGAGDGQIIAVGP